MQTSAFAQEKTGDVGFYERKEPRIEVRMPEPSEATLHLSAGKGDDLDLAFSQLNSLLDKSSQKPLDSVQRNYNDLEPTPFYQQQAPEPMPSEPTSLLPNYNMLYDNAPQTQAPPMPYK